MTYCFTRNDNSVIDGVRRIAVSQIDKAIAEIDDGDLDIQKTIHQVRKRCKKLRGLLRLVRPEFSGYQAENQTFRDAARALSKVRDSQAVIETYDILVARYADQIDASALSSIRRGLAVRRRQACKDRDLGKTLSDVRATMVQSRRRAHAWTIGEGGFGALSGGLGKTYKRARKAMWRAADHPTVVDLHEWRKRVKYHWYHARLLRETWPEMIGAHRDAAKQLSGLLGDHHDLAVLRGTLLEEPQAYGKQADLEAFVGLIDRRQAALEALSFALGRKLLAEKPAALVCRWRSYWTGWTAEAEVREKALAA